MQPQEKTQLIARQLGVSVQVLEQYFAQKRAEVGDTSSPKAKIRQEPAKTSYLKGQKFYG